MNTKFAMRFAQLFTLGLMTSCAVIQEEPVPAQVEKPSRGRVVRISNPSRFQSSPDITLINSVERNTDGTYCLAIDEDEAKEIGIPTEVFEKYVKIVELMNVHRK